MARRRKRKSSVEKFLPLGYFGVALACAVMLLDADVCWNFGAASVPLRLAAGVP